MTAYDPRQMFATVRGWKRALITAPYQNFSKIGFGADRTRRHTWLDRAECFVSKELDMVAVVDQPGATSSDADVRTSSKFEPAADDGRRVLLVSVVPFALLVAAGLSLAALMRESEPRPLAAGHSAGTSNHLQVAPEPKPAEPAHRPEPSRGTRNFSGIGF
jgi:hypothetical protein